MTAPARATAGARARRRREPHETAPRARIAPGGEPTIVEPRPLTPAGVAPDPSTGAIANGPASETIAPNGHTNPGTAVYPSVAASAPHPASPSIERMAIEGVCVGLWRALGGARRQPAGAPGGGAGADRRVGSGKTTLLRSLNRLTEITDGATRAGRIALDGEEIETMEVNALRRRISMVFQQPNPFPMSIYEDALLAAREKHPPGRRRQTPSAP